MKMLLRPACWLAFAAATTPAVLSAAADGNPFTRREDVIYGRKFGTALTFDVFTPQAKANGAAIVWAVSGGWFSAREAINLEFLKPLLERGYTVFAVVHGSQPKYTIPEAVADMNLAVRYIRLHADEFKIEPAPSASAADRPAGTCRSCWARPATWAIRPPRTPSARRAAGCRPWRVFFRPLTF